MADLRPDPTAPTAVADDVLADAVPAIPTIDLRVAQSKAEAALFGASEAVRIGRYRILERVGAGGMGVVWSAWDPELGRAVALKLASSGDTATRALAREEARALARLSHPNVVPIYDVLDHDDRVLLVMELIKGESLRSACKTRSPAQIIRAYRQAGDGLAAAHAAGLIHRDFKPDNALLGADGRVRVLDFGLAHEAGGGEGFIAGTPGYMAPEQERGERLTPAVDQYALCIALRESLTAAGGVPRWLTPVLTRGTAAEPQARFPSMGELLAALANDPATRWRRRALVGGGVLALAGTAGAFLLGRAQHRAVVEEPCTGGPGLLAGSWGPSRRAEVARALGALPGRYASDSAPALLATLDRYAARWIDLHRESCRAHERHELSSDLHDRRTACLSQPRAALATISDLAAQATDDDLPGLVQAASSLPDIAACADDAALLADGARPAAAIAPEVDAIDAGLARVGVERDAGRVDEATRDLAPLLVRAEATGFRPVHARALMTAGRIAMTAGAGDWGAASFGAATTAALAAGDDPLAVEGWARRAWSTAMRAEIGIGDALDGLALVQALDQRTGERGRFARALLHNNLGGVAMADGRHADALREFTTAHDLDRGLSPPESLELTVALENIVLLSEETRQRRDVGALLLRTRQEQVGPHHPLTLQAEAVVGSASPDVDEARARLADAVLDLARYHPSLGSTIADVAREPVLLAAVAGDRAQLAALIRAVEDTAAHGASAEHLALIRAFAPLAAGDPRRAVTTFRAELAAMTEHLTATSPWWLHARALSAQLGLIISELDAGDAHAARAELERARATLAQIVGSMPYGMAARRRDALARLDARLPP